MESVIFQSAKFQSVILQSCKFQSPLQYTVHSTFVGVTVPGPVTSLTVTERGSFHVKVEWQEPIDKNGIITNYIIEYTVGKHQMRLLHGPIFLLFNRVALSLDQDRK